MHLVTSSLFLSSVVTTLTPTSQEKLLRGYFIISLSWWVQSGCPDFDIQGFFSCDTDYPIPSGPLPTPDKVAIPSASSPKAVTPNPWMPILQTTMVHPDDHLPKIQRAFSHYATLYGSRAAGHPDFYATELPGAEFLDGSLFIRAAGLTAKRLGRIREGETPLSFWDRRGFYKS